MMLPCPFRQAICNGVLPAAVLALTYEKKNRIEVTALFTTMGKKEIDTKIWSISLETVIFN